MEASTNDVRSEVRGSIITYLQSLLKNFHCFILKTCAQGGFNDVFSGIFTQEITVREE